MEANASDLPSMLPNLQVLTVVAVLVLFVLVGLIWMAVHGERADEAADENDAGAPTDPPTQAMGDETDPPPRQ